MSLSTRAFLWVLVTGAVVLLSHAKFDSRLYLIKIFNNS